MSDIFHGVRGEGAELAGTPNTLSQTGKQLCGTITAPALTAQGTGIQPQASPYSLSILHQHHSSLLQLIPITAGLSQAISFPSCHSMGCPMQHREGAAENPESSLPWPSDGCDGISGNATGQLFPLLPRVSRHPELLTGIKQLKSSCACSAGAVGCAGSQALG